jgi:hypothetical protein
MGGCFVSLRLQKEQKEQCSRYEIHKHSSGDGPSRININLKSDSANRYAMRSAEPPHYSVPTLVTYVLKDIGDRGNGDDGQAVIVRQFLRRVHLMTLITRSSQVTIFGIAPGPGSSDTERTPAQEPSCSVSERRPRCARYSRVYNGFEVSINARFGRGGFIFGGITTEHTATNACADLAASNPNNLRFCDQTPPLQALYKASAAYTIPWDIQLSGTFQARPGSSIGSIYTFNSAQAGFAITGGGTLSVTVVDPTQQYYDDVKTVDTRVSKSIRAGRRRLQVFTELFNVPNYATILTVNETVGPLYFNPQAITAGRRVQFGAPIDW